MKKYEEWKVKYQSKKADANEYGKVDGKEAIQIAHDLAEDVYREIGGEGQMDEWEHYEEALNDIHVFANKLQWDDAIYAYTLNEDGQKELLAAIQAVSTEKLSNPSAYFADAEEAADRWNSSEDASIEISKLHTKSSNSEIIQLKKEWFDSEIFY